MMRIHKLGPNDNTLVQVDSVQVGEEEEASYCNPSEQEYHRKHIDLQYFAKSCYPDKADFEDAEAVYRTDPGVEEAVVGKAENIAIVSGSYHNQVGVDKMGNPIVQKKLADKKAVQEAAGKKIEWEVGDNLTEQKEVFGKQTEQRLVVGKRAENMADHNQVPYKQYQKQAAGKKIEKAQMYIEAGQEAQMCIGDEKAQSNRHSWESVKGNLVSQAWQEQQEVLENGQKMNYYSNQKQMISQSEKLAKIQKQETSMSVHILSSQQNLECFLEIVVAEATEWN